MRVVFEFWVGVFEAEIENQNQRLEKPMESGKSAHHSKPRLLFWLVLALCSLETPKGAHPAGLGCKPNWAKGPASRLSGRD